MKLLCVVVCLFVGSLASNSKELLDDWNDEYWNDDAIDKFINNYSGEAGQDDAKLVEEIETKDEAKVESAPAENPAAEDYQIEDNRSNEKEQNVEEVKAEESLVPEPNEEPMPDDGNIGEVPYEKEEPRFESSFEEFDDSLEGGFNKGNDFKDDNSGKEMFDDQGWFDSLEDEEEPVKENNDNIFEETKQILEEDSDHGFDEEAEQAPNVNNDQEKSENEENVEDTVAEENKNNDEADENNDEIVNNVEIPPGDANSETKEVQDDSEIVEDTPEKVYADLNADLDNLFKTLSKLNDYDDENEDKEENKEGDEELSVKDYEEKYNRPYREGAILSAREDYEEVMDSNLSDIFNENAEEDNSAEKFDSGESLGADEKIESIAQEKLELSENVKENPDNGESNVKDGLEFMDGSIDEDSNDDEIKQIFDDQPYGDDGLVAEGQPKDSDAEEVDNIDITNEKLEEQKVTEKTPESTTASTARTKMVDDLSSAEFDDLMTQFGMAHQEDFDFKSESFDRRVAPIHITLAVDTPTVVTSPNYPDRYPTNNIIDWIFEGEGRGIEMNITDFAVNGALGDYLLVKPGGVDESGHDGLIFSYRLNSERRFRFTDVDRMFVRFEARPGMPFMTGFRFSVRSILPPLTRIEDVPEPEAVVDPPKHTLTLNLAGLTVTEFRAIEDSFKELIADMAARYINENGIYYGLNSTLEVTQITRTALCSIHLPDHETCVQVTFGVPLNYGDEELEPRLNGEDLEDMWNSLADEDVFAERLAQMGVKEYLLPNDRAVVTVWVVIAAGVVISMALLGFALWRFSCFEDYTRMRSFSDNDSFSNEKRNLDLYPTPHQTLPPLYSESEYKWAEDKYDDSARVDMGGFANKSYLRDDLFEFESDEEVITPRERKSDVKSRDIYAV